MLPLTSSDPSTVRARSCIGTQFSIKNRVRIQVVRDQVSSSVWMLGLCVHLKHYQSQDPAA